MSRATMFLLRAAASTGLTSWIAGALLAHPMAKAYAHCDYEDQSSCVCYVPTGAWPASTVDGQVAATAENTLGTTVSCVPNGGQPYWQIQLQLNSPILAELIAHFAPTNSPFDLPRRQAWCSETVAYWHQMANVPTEEGYYTPLHPSCYAKSVEELILWYKSEEQIPDGRGRWVSGIELDYSDFIPGVNAPCPGAYQALEAFNTVTQTWSDSCRHSQVVDSMIVYRFDSADGPISSVDIVVIEGNSNSTGTKFVDINGDSTNAGTIQNVRRYENIFEFTRLGNSLRACDRNNQPETRRKIRGWGIDLRADGTPYCDESRIRTVVTPYTWVYSAPQSEPDPDSLLVARLKSFWVDSNGGQFGVFANASAIQTAGILPSESSHWIIPPGPYTVDPVYIQVDFKSEHPLPVDGIVVEWKDGIAPLQYQVARAGSNAQFVTQVVNLPSLSPPPNIGSVPVPTMFTPPTPSSVRYLRLVIPRAMINRSFEITGLHYLFDHGTEETYVAQDDAAATPVGGPSAAAWSVTAPLYIANRPNPFSEQTTMEYALPSAGEVDIRVLDVQGRLVRHFPRLIASSGRNTLRWDGSDDRGRRLPSGTYFYEVRSGVQSASAKMVLMR